MRIPCHWSHFRSIFVSPDRALSFCLHKRRCGASLKARVPEVSRSHSFSPLHHKRYSRFDQTNGPQRYGVWSRHKSDVLAKVANLPPPHHDDPRCILGDNDADGAGYQRCLPLSFAIRRAFIPPTMFIRALRAWMRRVPVIRFKATVRSGRSPSESHVVLDEWGNLEG